jgi:hypothetical protein
MNPYLEQEDAWHDFHERFMPLAAELLVAQLGPEYIVKIDEHVYIHEMSGEQRRLIGRADVAVARHSESYDRGATGTALQDAPARVTLPAVDVESVSVVEIRDRRTRQLITVIELLSPSNKKPGSNRDQYLTKRGQLLSSMVHLVEIDLLRVGQRMPMVELPACDYCVMISRVEQWPEAGVWLIQLREQLPIIYIPVRETDPEPQLDLQEMIHRIYDAAQYERFIYDGEPVPPLSATDAAWAESLRPKHAQQ